MAQKNEHVVDFSELTKQQVIRDYRNAQEVIELAKGYGLDIVGMQSKSFSKMSGAQIVEDIANGKAREYANQFENETSAQEPISPVAGRNSEY